MRRRELLDPLQRDPSRLGGVDDARSTCRGADVAADGVEAGDEVVLALVEERRLLDRGTAPIALRQRGSNLQPTNSPLRSGGRPGML